MHPSHGFQGPVSTSYINSTSLENHDTFLRSLKSELDDGTKCVSISGTSVDVCTAFSQAPARTALQYTIFVKSIHGLDTASVALVLESISHHRICSLRPQPIFLQSLLIVLPRSLLMLEEQTSTEASESDAEQAQRLIAYCAQHTPCLPGCMCLMDLPCLAGSNRRIQRPDCCWPR
jgi:hypothetical protein